MALPVLEAFTGPTFEDTIVDDKFTLTTPAGATQDEHLVALVATDDPTVNYPADDEAGSGWSLEIETNPVGASAISAAIYWLKVPASPLASYVFAGIGNTVMGGGMLRISGAHATAPIDASGVAFGDTDASVDCPDIPTTVIDTLILRMFAADDNDYPSPDSGYPAGHTGLFADQTTLGNDMSVGAAHIDQAGIGDTGIGRFTGMTPQEQWTAFTIAIAPSVGLAGAVLIDRINGGPFSGGVSASVEGIEFEAVQGTGTVKISPTDDVDDAGAVTQTITDWIDGQVTFTVVRGALALDTNVFLFVTNDSGISNTAGFVLQIVPEYILSFAEEIGVIFDMDFSVIPVRSAAMQMHSFHQPHLWFEMR